MKIQIQIEEEIKDKIVKDDISWHINNAREMLADKNTHPEDRVYFSKLLVAFEVVGEYYGIE